MKVTGSDHVSKVLNLILNKVGKADNGIKSAIITGNVDTTGVGVTVENPRIAALEKHFADVPDFEYNTHQVQLVIKGALMGGAIEETAEI